MHPSALHDALMTARHRSFIMPRLLGSFAALALFPPYLLARGAPSGLELLVLGWLVAPILIAYFLSRTGRYESAHALSALALTGLVTMVSALSGGIESFAAIWLVVVPLEAALSASRRIVAVASTLALGAAGLLAMLGASARAAAGRRSRPVAARSRSALSRPRFMRRVSRSAPKGWRAPASSCSTLRKRATGCWRTI